MKLTYIFISLVFFSACTNDVAEIEPVTPVTYIPTPYNLEIPSNFPNMPIPDDNPMTEEGVALGRKLFYDPILSLDNSISCGSCHNQEFGFTDNGLQFSAGIDNQIGDRNAMAIFNLGWNQDFFWDGRSETLEDQAFDPVPNPIEMHLSWAAAAQKLNEDDEYPLLFYQAFGAQTIDSTLVAKAIAQFERTIISSNSRFDQKERGEIQFTDQELLGETIFYSENADCFHCHGGRLFTFNSFHNNGLDANPADNGLGNVTGLDTDNGKFKAPSLRNIELTAPYMHDGRFETLEEVVDFYHSGVQDDSPNLDANMRKSNRGLNNGNLPLSDDDKKALVAFLKTLTDEDFRVNPAYSDPN